ncbi:MAG: carbohydrate ABC transporter permease, partial [Candidatus Izemoplasmatales bacterium]|nr:carbohydrate ABC transporter permease [Candidatus Izemoplasmatales bacterium]
MSINNKTKRYLLSILVIVVVLLIFTPIFLMIPSMFKDKYEIFAYPWTFFPINATLDNFRRIAYLQYTTTAINFFQSMLVTIEVATMAVVGALSINMIAAFAFAKLTFPGKKFLWPIIISTMFIPGITILLTSIRVVTMLHMLDTIWVLVIPGLVSAYNIFFFRQFYLGFPKELDEAAKIDGASTWQIFFRIYFPMSKTPMVIIGASIFMGYYNSYLWPTLTISHDRQDLVQIMYLIRMLFSDASTLGYGSVLAATFISLIPPLIIFV